MAKEKCELIITEKPAQAEKIASALADKTPKKKIVDKVPYYEIKHDGKDILVGCAVGHLFALAEKKKKKGWGYPVFDVEWKPAYLVKKSSAFSKKYLKVLEKIAKQANSFTVACDYDNEGSVIGFNCVRFICKKKDARRMKFSTLTKDELIESYKKASKHLDFPQIEAGETRHFLDYYWGISLSRALTLAIKTTGAFKLMSVGRVQGPALNIIVERENEIKAFKPEPYWEIDLKTKNLLAQHKDGKIFDKKKVTSILRKTKDKDGVIASVKEKEFLQEPPHPFDLTTLQTEAYRCFGITPKETLSVAQELYTAGFISYPRTSSQKLPSVLGYKKIITSLAKQKDYAGGKTFLENIAESGFGEGGFGKGGVLATLGKRAGKQIAAPFTKEGRSKLWEADMSPLDFYKGHAPGITEPDYSYIAGGDPVGQSKSAVEQILSNLPSDYYGGR